MYKYADLSVFVVVLWWTFGIQFQEDYLKNVTENATQRGKVEIR